MKENQRKAMWAKRKNRDKLIIFGQPAYIRRMYLHLMKEHPSTRTRMVKVQK
jgi:hypothetical protein